MHTLRTLSTGLFIKEIWQLEFLPTGHVNTEFYTPFLVEFSTRNFIHQKTCKKLSKKEEKEFAMGGARNQSSRGATAPPIWMSLLPIAPLGLTYVVVSSSLYINCWQKNGVTWWSNILCINIQRQNSKVKVPTDKFPFWDYGENSGVEISVYKIPPSKFWCIKFLWSKILSKEFL